MALESLDIQEATTAVRATNDHRPDAKTRRYDRQLRLWAATGQAALESARILVISASATSTAIVKNLVLPGVGEIVILDSETVSPADAGNNFFFEGQKSIGKNRAHEAARLLGELNEDVKCVAETSRLQDFLRDSPEYLSSFTLLIAHNLDLSILERLSEYLWADDSRPPLVVVRSAGFLAEFFIQFHGHAVVESHSEVAPSLRIIHPFAALKDYALSLDFDNMDPTDHSHIPFVVILVRALEDWKATHNGISPRTSAEKQEFKKAIASMKKKHDEENFEEAEAQAYRCWSEAAVPASILELFSDPGLSNLGHTSPSFFHLLSVLKKYVSITETHTLPLSPALPDMKADTESYVHLQNMYKIRAREEKAAFGKILQDSCPFDIDETEIDSFVRNAHALVFIRGSKWGKLDNNRQGLLVSMEISPKGTATHLALTALSRLHAQSCNQPVTVDNLHMQVDSLIGERGESLDILRDTLRELVRAPTADMPNVAAFLGGLVAQEAIKLITKQYIPIRGHCVVDLVEMSTSVIGTD